MTDSKRILLAHGAGGRMTAELTQGVFVPAFDNPMLSIMSDSALLPEPPPGRLAMSTDAFVVDPVIFPGGDLGYLSVCGTVNDLAVAGARPLWLTWALVLEEGLEHTKLATFVEGARRAAKEADVVIVAGDTKVVPRGKGDQAFITTAGLGVVAPGRDLGDQNIRPGDAVVVSGPLGDHGATILACRHGLESACLVSDCRPMAGLVGALLESGVAVRALHDPTRGGAATTCNEVAGRSGLRMVLEQPAIPVRPETQSVCDLLGLDPLYLACEGRVLIWVAEEDADGVLSVLHAHEDGSGACRIGTVLEAVTGTVPVTLRTALGVERPLDVLSGLDLPRIC